ncbi:unnamed protein product [Brassicogethes aeneus]|uniref:Mitotic checkpoint serine/threonine-protein kinase BUB1 n=1 Tax=Brassicogethes aeneus TaxID=1431903 RepID=A0A9P0B922_BRAAE|nr:unnamed protein product [Brassicogethes aeneus]
MDFDLSKENIQPLRGGRNPTQLGIALQAQTNPELQLELEKQKEEFESAIRNYNGEDPLDNYYHYISWVEQSYPKHGHEGNLVALLEHCLAKFENDVRYSDDRRFCKLWIKYIDLQQNPLELYHMMHAQNLCRGCADLYRAWAYYHEAAQDFQGANNVLELGKRALAQPYEELEAAYQNLLTAVGQYNLHGPDAARRGLIEKRQALTSLVTYRPGRVGSVRVPTGAGAGVLPSGGPAQKPRPNAGVQVYEEQRDGAYGGPEAAPQSILSVARRQDAPKENTMKPGPWNTASARKKVAVHRNTLGFTVHEDGSDSPEPVDFHRTVPRECLEDYSNWKPNIHFPEPFDARMIPIYPKDRVYIDPNTEYSIDELRAHRYRKKTTKSTSFSNTSLMEHSLLQQKLEQQTLPKNTMEHSHLFPSFDRSTTYNPLLLNQPECTLPANVTNATQQSVHAALLESVRVETPDQMPPDQMPPSPEPVPNASIWRTQVDASPAPPVSFGAGFWDSGAEDSPVCVTKSRKVKVDIYEQSIEEMPTHFIQPKGSAMKTPFKTLSADELAETGSRGGMDIAETAHSDDSAHPMAAQSCTLSKVPPRPPINIFNDDSSSSYEEIKFKLPVQDLNNTCTTQTFNLNCMHVSTPDNKRQHGATSADENQAENTRKQLFAAEPPLQLHNAQPKSLSVIMEESNGYRSSSLSGGSSGASKLSNQTKQNAMATVEEHSQSSNYAQNSMVNAALRRSLLGIMDFDTSNYMQVTVQEPPPPMFETMNRTIPKPANVKPLHHTPQNPFDSNVINELLDRVRFPGPHTEGFYQLSFIPSKLCCKKDPIYIGNDEYIIEKQLGKGTYGTVYKAFDNRRRQNVALKYQKVPNKWEYHICREIQARLTNDDIRSHFMDVSLGYFNNQYSILISEYMPWGSLLDMTNLVKQKTGKSLKECLCYHFTNKMLRLVKTLHEIQIIHADIKPDNFLVMLKADGTVDLQLIDFGCSIDMSLFPPHASFTHRITTDAFICCEMRDGRPWNYHTDLFCVAASAHVLIFEKYICLQKIGSEWSVNCRWQRYHNKELWKNLFDKLLNQNNGPADVEPLQISLEEAIDGSSSFQADVRYLINLLKDR